MKAHEKHLVIQKTSRYYTYGNLSEKTKNIWIVFHGYGQLAKYFIPKFQSLDSDENFVIALEGLSKFYLNGFSGRVGATWMTKDMREEEVKDYLSYINDVVKSELSDQIASCALYVLGFSQGCHTACRWVAENKLHPAKLILWSGGIPKEYEGKDVFDHIPMLIMLGNKDELLTTMHFQELEKAKAHIPSLEFISFEGGHELSDELFQRHLPLLTSQ